MPKIAKHVYMCQSYSSNTAASFFQTLCKNVKKLQFTHTPSININHLCNSV